LQAPKARLPSSARSVCRAGPAVRHLLHGGAPERVSGQLPPPSAASPIAASDASNSNFATLQTTPELPPRTRPWPVRPDALLRLELLTHGGRAGSRRAVPTPQTPSLCGTVKQRPTRQTKNEIRLQGPKDEPLLLGTTRVGVRVLWAGAVDCHLLQAPLSRDLGGGSRCQLLAIGASCILLQGPRGYIWLVTIINGWYPPAGAGAVSACGLSRAGTGDRVVALAAERASVAQSSSGERSRVGERARARERVRERAREKARDVDRERQRARRSESEGVTVCSDCCMCIGLPLLIVAYCRRE
jgi:hypothetical protein